MRDKMKCPNCETDMNYHAEKMNYEAMLSEPTVVDAELGGILEEFHTCPECGRTESRI